MIFNVAGTISFDSSIFTPSRGGFFVIKPRYKKAGCNHPAYALNLVCSRPAIKQADVDQGLLFCCLFVRLSGSVRELLHDRQRRAL